MKLTQFLTNPIYHIYNRGVEKRITFIDKDDYERFINDLEIFNSTEPVIPAIQRFNPKFESYEVGPRKRLVDLFAFTLMPNHFHLLAQPIVENGITKFMQKLGTGYVMYFNKKYERVGPLFQGGYKTALITQENHFIRIPFYIHANPLDRLAPQWRNNKINNFQAAMEYLENYRWSSFRDYIGKINYPTVTQRNFLLECCGGSKAYHAEFIKFMKNMDLDHIKDALLD